MAVDNLGRYALSDMRDRVRRLLDSLSITVNQTTGVEGAAQIQDQSYSNTDIVNRINESLTLLYGQMITGRETLFAATTWASISANNPGPYQFPPDMIQLRWMKWKDPSVAFIPPAMPKPIQWHPMTLIDDPSDYDSQINIYDVPTWRWEADHFFLNEVPLQDNTNGIMINYVALPAELVNDIDVISVPQFVRVAQQVLIYDVAYTLAFSKQKQIAAELSTKRSEWLTLLMTLVQNAYNTQSVQMVAPSRMHRNTYTGRSKLLGGRRRAW